MVCNRPDPTAPAGLAVLINQFATRDAAFGIVLRRVRKNQYALGNHGHSVLAPPESRYQFHEPAAIAVMDSLKPLLSVVHICVHLCAFVVKSMISLGDSSVSRSKSHQAPCNTEALFSVLATWIKTLRVTIN